MSNHIFKDKYIHKVLRNHNVRENGGYSYISYIELLITLMEEPVSIRKFTTWPFTQMSILGLDGLGFVSKA